MRGTSVSNVPQAVRALAQGAVFLCEFHQEPAQLVVGVGRDAFEFNMDLDMSRGKGMWRRDLRRSASPNEGCEKRSHEHLFVQAFHSIEGGWVDCGKLASKGDPANAFRWLPPSFHSICRVFIITGVYGLFSSLVVSSTCRCGNKTRVGPPYVSIVIHFYLLRSRMATSQNVSAAIPLVPKTRSFWFQFISLR